jgi:hypothetical protein
MPTPLEEYLANRKAKGLSQVPHEFAIGTDNDGADNLLVGIKEFTELGKTIPQTLAWSLLDSKNPYSYKSNMSWVEAMVKSPRMKLVHIYHIQGRWAISKGVDRWRGGMGTISSGEFRRHYRGTEGSTYDEIVAVIEGGFVNIDYIGQDDYVGLWR